MPTDSASAPAPQASIPNARRFRPRRPAPGPPTAALLWWIVARPDGTYRAIRRSLNHAGEAHAPAFLTPSQVGEWLVLTDCALIADDRRPQVPAFGTPESFPR